MLKSSYERFKKISQKNSAIFEICECRVDEALTVETIKQPAIIVKCLAKMRHQCLAKMHDFNLVAKEARFRILNTIYKNAFLQIAR